VQIPDKAFEPGQQFRIRGHVSVETRS